jgi:peptidyl-prolyl cis-trans isomerase SurA
MTSNRLRLAGVVVVALAVLGAVVNADILEQILVKVNGEIFTKTDLENRQVAALRQLGQQIDPKSNPTDQQLRKMLDEVTPQLMVSVVDEMLLVQRAKELGYKMSDEQFKSILDSIKKDNKINSEEEFQAALKQENMTLADLRRNLERQWMVSRVQQNEVLGRIGVTEEEARKYYEAHKSEFTSPSNVTLREILVSVPKEAKATDETAAQQKATEIRQRVLGGESFDKLAAEASDSPSRANGGLIGPLSLNDVSPDLKKLLEGMKPGDVSEVLHGPTGYQILKLESITAAQTMAFEQAREEISNRVFTDKRKDEYGKYLTKLRSDAIIEWKNDDVKKAYETGLAQQKAGVTSPLAQQ